ncbi:hypothetical protein OC25_23815 [Pedobacter kyungheensis]|uniref:Uncharacterized protein n=1 Tax=Pedobacter kyungheensis TaxID=1069985 RepID=A0A0C1DAE3_9SPHI|nr:hypothetical protein [Pedobacter kyungheensis]KIA90930.1 hypothetical protein OC25_23815 [Pedobacter kyungheensis]
MTSLSVGWETITPNPYKTKGLQILTVEPDDGEGDVFSAGHYLMVINKNGCRKDPCTRLSKLTLSKVKINYFTILPKRF